MNAKDSAVHGAHEDERWREAKRRRIRELEAEVVRLKADVSRWERRFDAWQDWRVYETLKATGTT